MYAIRSYYVIAPDAVVVNNLVSNISCDDGASDGSISFDIRGGVITGGNQSYEITRNNFV